MKSAMPAAAGRSSDQPLVTEEFRVPADDLGIELYVRNKRPASMSQFPGERVLLFVHGSPYPAETAFDLPLDGMSWMDYIARHGYDVYLVDVRGYGGSTRPPEMDQPADSNPPLVRTEVAVRDVGSAVDFIRKRRGVDRINLLGWSWGTTMMATYTTRNNAKVAKLVLYAPRMAPLDAPAHRRQRPVGCLPPGAGGRGEGALAYGGTRSEGGRAHSARLVRGLGRCNLRFGSTGCEGEPAQAARAERHAAGHPRVLERGEAVLRAGGSSRGDAHRGRRMGSGQPARAGADSTFRSSSTRRTSSW